MKTIYIPKGETIRYESLATEHLVVHGCLQVTCGITAKTITGYGTVHAGTVNADVIRVDDMDAGSIVCKRLLAKRVQSPEVFASESAAVSCFLSAAYVETGKLTVTLSEIDTVNAAEIVILTENGCVRLKAYCAKRVPLGAAGTAKSSLQAEENMKGAA